MYEERVIAMLSVRPSVRPSLPLVDCDQTGRNSSKINPNIMDLLLQILAGIGEGIQKRAFCLQTM